MAEEMERRFNSFILVGIFEALESYLKALYGEMLYQLRNDIRIPDKKKFHKMYQGLSNHKGTNPYYVQYAQYVCKGNCDQARAAFTEYLDWKKAKRLCPIGLDFNQIVKTLGFCRHRIVHKEGRVTEKCLRALSKKEYEFISTCLYKTVHTDENLLLPPQEVLDEILVATASYGWATYKLLAERCAMNDESGFFRPLRGP
jgi:hypothetical protein